MIRPLSVAPFTGFSIFSFHRRRIAESCIQEANHPNDMPPEQAGMYTDSPTVLHLCVFSPYFNKTKALPLPQRPLPSHAAAISETCPPAHIRTQPAACHRITCRKPPGDILICNVSFFIFCRNPSGQRIPIRFHPHQADGNCTCNRSARMGMPGETGFPAVL